MGKVIDLTGQKFGRLIVIKRLVNDKYSRALWLCRCICGQVNIVRTSDLNSGNTKSCGCLRKEITSKRRLKHGYAKNKKNHTYNVWLSMIQRCTNPNYYQYRHYGGRGIKICDRWMESNGQGFLGFLKDMGERPPRMTIDRINVNGNYEPNNCRWTTQKIQQRNRTNNIWINIDGQDILLVEYCEDNNLSYHKIYKRLRRGWSIEDAIK